jgi:phage host-nuclease inhibitor protein Gam
MRRTVKLPESEIQTRDEADVFMGRLAELQTASDALTAEMDAEIQAVRQAYEKRLNRLAESTKPLTVALQFWAEMNKETWPAKSLDLVHGRLGFRTGTPSVRLVRGVTEAAALDFIRQRAEWAARYIRTADSINREALITDRELLTPATQAAMGIKIAQSEPFYIEPKHEENPVEA